MNSNLTQYKNPYQREIEANQEWRQTLRLSEWNVQQIVTELVVNQFMMNNPRDEGYQFDGKIVFDANNLVDKAKSDVFIDNSFKWDETATQKRPAIIISRSNSSYANVVMNQSIGNNIAESQQHKMAITSMGVGISCISDNMGLAERLAEFVKQPFLYFQEQIRRDFCFRQFKLVQIDPPQPFTESKNHFLVMINLMTTFDAAWVVQGQHLKLKTMSRTIFDRVAQVPLTNQ